LPNKTSDNPGSTKPALYYHYAGLTNTGMVRDHNEDAFKLPGGTDAETLADKGHLYVLADGMGGHQKGEVASAITIESINAAYYSSTVPIAADNEPQKVIANNLTKAIEIANTEVMEATQGGGTTVVATVLWGDSLISMNVGDSRAYLLRNSELHLISKDHSLVSRLVEMGKITEEEALTHPRRNVLYQALGQGTEVDIYTVSEQLKVNDIIIICSDGLWGEVGNELIQEVLDRATNPREAVEELINLANESGGPDNITAIIIRVSDQVPPAAGYVSEFQSPAPPPDLDDTKPSGIAPRHQKPDVLPEGEN
jgi:serine/threonine protein phosphatase PrpC